MNDINENQVHVITVTTFGVNGAPVDKNGRMIYPVISWQCQRTLPMVAEASKLISSGELYYNCGVQDFSFNTIYNLLWFKKHKPEILEKTKSFVFISSLIVQKLCGEIVNDTTMAGTSGLTDLRTRKFSSKILGEISVQNVFEPMAEPGTEAGKILPQVSNETGIPVGVPVVLAGHDTQFALLGSGADENEPVLSSGTWEILMVRSSRVNTSEKMYKQGVTNEWDAIPGLYNIGVQWLASGVLEWVKNLFFKNELNLPTEQLYNLMISEATKSPGTENLVLNPDFLNNNGSLTGIGLHTSRGQIYSSALQAMADKTKAGLAILEESGGFKASQLVVVGGGSKNMLWNQIRAKTLKIPVKIISVSETTVLGAALIAFVGAGLFSNIAEARKNVDYNPKLIF
jgi:L-fuculokinase